MSKHVIDGGDWIALRADDTEEEGDSYVAIYPGDYLSKENFVGLKHLGNFLMNDRTRRGEDRVCVIQREADGTLFGFEFYHSGGKHGEDYAESNADAHEDKLTENGANLDYDNYDEYEHGWFVFTPVEPHAIPTYKFTEAAK